MGYTASVKYLWEIVDEIADGLIADAAWEEGDATWDTTDKTGANARRVVHHIADDVYVSIVAQNNSTQVERGTYDWFFKGLIIVFSSSWDGVAHEPDGSKYYTYAPFNGEYRYGPVLADLEILDIDYRLFTSAKGFALVGVPSPYLSDSRQTCFIVVVERNASKLYADGFTNFYIFVDGNYIDSNFNLGFTSVALFGSTYKWWRYSRPFTLQSQDGYEFPYDALGSRGDDKAYFTKPILHNDEDNLSPIFQGEMFISVHNDRGLIDDDEISVNGKKYQVTIKQSPASTVYMKYAIAKAE